MAGAAAYHPTDQPGTGRVDSLADDVAGDHPASTLPAAYAQAGHHGRSTARAQHTSVYTFQGGAHQQSIQARPSANWQTSWITYLNALDEETARSILGAVIEQSPLVQDLVYRHGCAAIQAEEDRQRKERQRVISFEGYSPDAWYILNEKYSSSSGSKECRNAFNAQ